jgi:RNA polymerase sigma-70 factor, ECF subfamily
VPNDTDSDAALVARMAAGDERALGVLYDRWATTVHTIAYYLLGQADDAEDAVEETFWQAWREAGRYDASRGAVSTWLSTIARSRALDRQRARQRRAEEPLEGVVSSSDGSGGIAGSRAPSTNQQQEAEASERARDVAAALEKLPAEQREVIELAYFGGLSQSEIATRTSLPLGTVKTRARLALEKLRAPLAQHREEAR